MERRGYLLSACTMVSIYTSGCMGLFTSPNPDGETRPEDEPENVPSELQCEDNDLERLGMTYEEEVQWGDSGGFSLRVNSLSHSYGDRVTVSLTNTASETQETGAKTKYSIEQYTEQGWEEVRTIATESDALPVDTIEYTDIVKTHDTGEGFQWELLMTDDGLRLPDGYREIIHICPGLSSGRYRFVYWGLPEPVAVAFDLHRED